MSYTKAAIVILATKKRFIERLRVDAEQCISDLKAYADEVAQGIPPWSEFENYQHSSEEQHRSAEQFNWRAQNRVGTFTLMAAVAAAGLAGLTFHETQRQANAAFSQLALTRGQEVQQLRAYVGAPAADLSVDCGSCDSLNRQAGVQPDKPLNNVEFKLENFGDTPAYSPSVCGRFIDGDKGKGLSEDLVDQALAKCPDDPMPTIWPKEERPYFAPMDLKDLMNAREGNKTGWFIARYQYTDAFNCRRTEYMTFEYAFAGSPLKDWFIGRDDHNHPEDKQSLSDNPCDKTP